VQDVTYHVHFTDGRSISVSVDPDGGQAPADLPDWTRLEFHQCPNCPLARDTAPRCPMAVQFVKLVDSFGDSRSYDPVRVEVDTPERTVSKETTVQRALGSVMGLLAASSACPHTDFLKPMAHFHLPFATEEETIYRVASMYLLTQYLDRRNGGTPDWTLAGLKAHYQDLQVVNAAMARRLRALCAQDGAINALVLLDLLAKALPDSIDLALEDVERHFRPAGR
jgi:hypothetical protein